MEKAVLYAALAGLLHNIGKVAMRAAVAGSLPPLDSSARGTNGHYDAVLTADFIDKYVPSAWSGEVKRLSANHPLPEQAEEQVIRIADQLSAGEQADPTEGPNQRDQQPRQLQSVFTIVETKTDAISGDRQKNKEKIKIKEHAPQAAYWPLAALSTHEKAVFPGEVLPDSQVWGIYTSLWMEFCSAADQLKQTHTTDGDLNTYLDSLQLLLQRYTWCIPSAYYNSVPDVSLYDHSHMTGALAALLCERDDATLTKLGTATLSDSDEEIALLVGGDLSGVQDFIYTITSRGATPGLRGRSFYLQLLTEASVRLVLRRLKLPLANLIYAGGGNFYLLARAKDVDKLREVQLEISQTLLRHHQGALYLAIAHQEMHARDFFNGGVSELWKSLGQTLSTAKLQRFRDLGQGIKGIFEPQGNGGNEEKQCQVCGLEHPDTVVVDQTETSPQGTRKCPGCLSYEVLGDALRKARYLTLNTFEPIRALRDMGKCSEALAELGMGISLHDDAADLLVPKAETAQTVLALDDEDAGATVPSLAHRATGRRMFVNVTPTITPHELAKAAARGVTDLPEGIRHDIVKPFSVMVDESTGIKRLGILRMDVDNLGDLFASGLGKRATLSRIASLSATVTLFFEGWISQLAREVDTALNDRHEPVRRNKLYSIYSGGDDLFFVGSWDVVMALAQRIRADLARYAGGHPGIHVSGGLVLVGAKYPLAQAAQDGHHAEQQAKGLERVISNKPHTLLPEHDQKVGMAAETLENPIVVIKRKKDALTFLGKSLPWEQIGNIDATGFDTATGVYTFLCSLVETSGNNALIGKLAQQYADYVEAERARREAGIDRDEFGNAKVLYGPWHWRLAYLLGQQEDRTRDDKPTQKRIASLREALKKNDYRAMEWLGLAARWAQYSLRD